jgi:hypothetical protein
LVAFGLVQKERLPVLSFFFLLNTEIIMITIANKEGGFYSEGDTMHYMVRYNRGLTVSLMKQDDNVNLTLMFNRELGYWPYKIEDTTDFKTYLENKINLFLGRFDLYLPASVESKGGSYTVEDLNINHTLFHEPWYLEFKLVFKTEAYNGPDITAYEIVRLSKKLNKFISQSFKEYKESNDITRSDIIKEGKWRRYVNELYKDYIQNHHRKYQNSVHGSDLPF